VLSASYLNGLSANQSFLFGLANSANPGFNSFRSTHVTLDQNHMVWYVRHKVNWFHYRVTSQSDQWNYCRIYYNGVKVAADETAGVNTVFQGQYDLSSWAGLPNLRGAWVTATAYEDDVHGGGAGGNGDDGSVVTQGGSYYRCKLAHTSSSTNQPGSGASWTTYWDLLTLPGVGTMCIAWADVNFNAGVEVTVDYFVETDSSSF
jgi:hypothetical protein